jgi:hypothetical protein
MRTGGSKDAGGETGRGDSGAHGWDVMYYQVYGPKGYCIFRVHSTHFHIATIASFSGTGP